MDKKKEVFKENSQAVQSHLGILQSVIQRMATNSSSCKAWCITLVSAILVVIADKNKPNYSYIALLPIILFFMLVTYYLSLEKGFASSYNAFIKKLHQNDGVNELDLYQIKPNGSIGKHFGKSILSFSIWPFYGALLATIELARRFVLD